MSLQVDLRVADRLAASFEVPAGEVVAVVGPNGAGKTTLLRALAGLAGATGTLRLDGADLQALPVDRRGIGWVPQAGLLFPHLTALDNVAYGVRGRQRRVAAAALLADLGVAHLADRLPAQLSGGQAQRVALARALSPDPRLVLLDEPLAALDATARDDVRLLLRRTLTGRGVTALVVTHDPVDVLALADRVLVLEQGRVVQDAPTRDVVAAPRSAWVARLLGLNAWAGTAAGGGAEVGAGVHIVAADEAPEGAAVLVLVPPAAVALHRVRPEGSPRNVLRGEVSAISGLGGRVRVVVGSEPSVIAEVTAAAALELGLAEGGAVWASFKATEVRLVPV